MGCPASQVQGRTEAQHRKRDRDTTEQHTAWSCGEAWSSRRPVKAEVAGSNPVRTALAPPVDVSMMLISPVGATWLGRVWQDGCTGAGSSVGTSVRLKSGRSAVRPRPCPRLNHLVRRPFGTVFPQVAMSVQGDDPLEPPVSSFARSRGFSSFDGNPDGNVSEADRPACSTRPASGRGRMRVDRYRNFDRRVSGDVPNRVRRHAQVQEQGHANMTEIMKTNAFGADLLT